MHGNIGSGRSSAKEAKAASCQSRVAIFDGIEVEAVLQKPIGDQISDMSDKDWFTYSTMVMCRPQLRVVQSAPCSDERIHAEINRTPSNPSSIPGALD